MNFIQEKYKSIKKKWLNKTPKEKWSFCHKIGDFSLRVVGVHVFSDNKIYFWSYSSTVIVITYVILSTYTIIVSYMENDFKECFKCLCVSGVMASV